MVILQFSLRTKENNFFSPVNSYRVTVQVFKFRYTGRTRILPNAHRATTKNAKFYAE